MSESLLLGEHLGDGLRDRRNRALLLLGFTGALPRSKQVGLEVRDAQITREGIVLTIRRSNTDQEAKGMTRSIAYQLRHLPSTGAPDLAGVCISRLAAFSLAALRARAAPRPQWA